MTGHHVQTDVKFASLTNLEVKKVRRFQYTKIVDTRRRTMKIYTSHNQQNAIKILDYMIRYSLSAS